MELTDQQRKDQLQALLRELAGQADLDPMHPSRPFFGALQERNAQAFPLSSTPQPSTPEATTPSPSQPLQ